MIQRNFRGNCISLRMQGSFDSFSTLKLSSFDVSKSLTSSFRNDGTI